MPKYMKLVQCDVGSYNMLGGEDLSFCLVIYDNEEGEPSKVTQRGGYDCKVSFLHGEDLKYYKRLFQSYWDNGDIISILQEAYPIVKRYVGSGKLEELLAFTREFEVHHYELLEDWADKRKAQLTKEIESLQTKLERSSVVPREVTEDDVLPLVKDFVEAHIDDYRKWAEQSREMLRSLKKKTEAYQREARTLKKWEDRIEQYEKFLTI